MHGHIEGSKPVTNLPFNYVDPSNLKTTDIDGTQVGSKNKIERFSSQNYNLLIKDIKGTRSGSLQKGIISNRCLNPLEPQYILPGQLEIKNNENNPYAKANVKPKSANVDYNCENNLNYSNLNNQ